MASSKRVPKWCGELEQLDDEHCCLSLGADSLDNLVTMLVMTGVDFEVIEPLDLIPELRKVSERLTRAFG